MVFFIVISPVTDFSTLPWLLFRGCGPCLAGRRPSRNVFLCVCIDHSVVLEDKMVCSQVSPSRSREALFLMLIPRKKCKKAADEKTTFVAVMSDRLNNRLLVQWTTRPLHNTRVGGPWEDQQNDLCYNCKQSTLTVLKLLHKSKLI